MGIWERLENVIKSYTNYGGYEDPDLSAAYEELDDFLRQGKDTSGEQTRPKPREKMVPTELLEDFAELGLPPEASMAECKAAYKKLLKIHHPDRHNADPETMKKATEKTARVNAAYQRLENWLN